MAMGSKNRDEIIRKIRNNDAFEIGNMSARLVHNVDHVATGKMPATAVNWMRLDKPIYVVYSYGTPIAWIGINGPVVPDGKYSATTSNHQSITRMALDV